MEDNVIKSLVKWGRKLREKPDELELAILKSRRDNKWFEVEYQWKAINAISTHFLNEANLRKWLAAYEMEKVKSQRIGLICAGNVPAVGFHDVLSILVSGHKGLVKLSSKDEHLLPAMLSLLTEVDTELAANIEFVDKLKMYDAVIATGSDNSARYFYEYFSHVPHLIRKNRQGIAIINDDITDEEIRELRNDVFTYFGLGCRNVSMVMLPQMFDRERLYAHITPERSMRDNDKYANNYNYNLAVCMMEHIEFKTNDELLFIEREDLHSRIASLHLMSYESEKDIEKYLEANKEKIQCIVANKSMKLQVPSVKPGETQQPELWDYADGVDTLEFLLNLNKNK